jgi:hypothetical protein
MEAYRPRNDSFFEEGVAGFRHAGMMQNLPVHSIK